MVIFVRKLNSEHLIQGTSFLTFLIKNVIAPYYKKNEQKDINTVSTMNCSKLKVIRKQLNVFHTLIN